MKEAGKPQLEVQEALQELKKRKKQLETKVIYTSETITSVEISFTV